MRFRKFKFFCLAMLLVAGTILGIVTDKAAASSATENEDQRFDVGITCGLNGYSKYNSYMPVYLTVTNNGEDFSGNVRIIFDSDGYTADRIAYTKAFLAAAGETREVSITVPETGMTPIFTIIIEDEDGNVLYNRRIRTSMQYTNDIYVGMLTSDFNGLNYMDGIPFFSSYYNDYISLRIFKLDETIMPDSGVGLENLDVIVINDYDTSLLSEQQYGALKMWVSNGGMLLIGTGANYNKTLSLFKDNYLTGSVGSLSTASADFNLDSYEAVRRSAPLEYEEQTMEALENTELIEDSSEGDNEAIRTDSAASSETAASYVEESTDNSMVDINLGDVTPLELNAVDLTLDGGVSYPGFLCQAVDKGAGRVFVFQFDLSAEPFVSWEHNTDAMQNFFRTLADVEVKGQFHSTSLDVYYVQDMLSNYIADKLPGISRYAVILVIYILLISPIAYLLLKKLDKRHLIWGIVPVLAVVFTGAVFMFGSSTRQKEPYLNYSTILTIDNNKASEKTYLSATSPNNRRFSFDIGDNYLVSPLSGYTYNTNFLFGISSPDSDTGDSSYDMNLTYATDKTTVDVENIRAFGSKYLVAERERDINGAVDIDLTYVDDHYEGTVTNHTGYYIEDGFMKLGNSLILVGNLNDGESFTIDESTPTINNKNYYEIADVIYNNVGNSSGSDRDAVKQKMLRSYLNGTRNAYYTSTTIQSTYQFNAFIANYPVNVADASGYDSAGQVLLTENVDISYTKDGSFYVPNILEGCKVISGEIDGTEYYFYSDDAVMECYIPDAITEVMRLSVVNPGMDMSDMTSAPIIYYLYNWETGVYEHVFADGGSTMSGVVLDKYINNNVMRIRFEKSVKNTYASMTLPIISLSGR